MRSRYGVYKTKVVALRRKGKTYGEIIKNIGQPIAKSTLSYWCRNVPLPSDYKERLKSYNQLNLTKARKIALVVNKIRREKYLKKIRNRVKLLRVKLKDKDTAKIALTMLYLGEGAKRMCGSLMFGNSDPAIIRLFLELLRYCYKIDESKFRCTVQCRADQNVKKLEKFWFEITKIPFSQFYKARIDPRTVGKPTKKPEYKGVCRIDYFSAEIFIELKEIIKVVTKGP